MNRFNRSRLTALIGACALLMTSASSFAAKPCEELKAEVAKKIEANGVKTYTLEIVAAKDAEPKDGDKRKVVGSCEGGSKKLVYERK